MEMNRGRDRDYNIGSVLGAGEIRDLLLDVMNEEDRLRVQYRDIKQKADKMIRQYLQSKYDIKEGDSVFDVESRGKLQFEMFLIGDEGIDDPRRGIDSRPAILARAKFPFGLGKPKKYFPADWMTEQEFRKISQKS